MAEDQVPNQTLSEGVRVLMLGGDDGTGVARMVGVGSDGGMHIGDQAEGQLVAFNQSPGEAGQQLYAILKSLETIEGLLAAQNAILAEAFETFGG